VKLVLGTVEPRATIENVKLSNPVPKLALSRSPIRKSPERWFVSKVNVTWLS